MTTKRLTIVVFLALALFGFTGCASDATQARMEREEKALGIRTSLPNDDPRILLSCTEITW